MEANWDAYLDSCMLDDQESDTNFNPADEPNGLMEHVMDVGEWERMSMPTLRHSGAVGLEQRPEVVYAPWQLAELDMQRNEMEQAGIFPRVRLSFDMSVGAS